MVQLKNFIQVLLNQISPPLPWQPILQLKIFPPSQQLLGSAIAPALATPAKRSNLATKEIATIESTGSVTARAVSAIAMSGSSSAFKFSAAAPALVATTDNSTSHDLAAGGASTVLVMTSMNGNC